MSLAWTQRLLGLQVLLEGRLRTDLGIKANPPAYQRTVSSIARLLSAGFKTDAAPLIQAAVDDIAATADLPINKRAPAAKRRVEQLARELGAAGVDLPPERVAKIGRALGAAYKLGLDEVAKPMGWQVGFMLPDTDALAGLHDAGLFWVGEHYGDAFDSPTLLATVKDVMVTQGLGRVAGGKALAKAFGDQLQRSDTYWRGLAATVSTRARSFGALTSLVETGAVTYEYINPDDERTSEVCHKLNGLEFTVAGSITLREQVLAATEPEAVKAITPWPRPADLLQADGATLKLPAELQALGIAWPPLHFHCRSSIEVAEWGPMPDASDPIGDVDIARRIKPI